MSEAVDPRSPLGREIQAAFSATSESMGKAQALEEQTRDLPAAIGRSMKAYEAVSGKLAEAEGPSEVDLENTKLAAADARLMLQGLLLAFQEWTAAMDRTIEAGMTLRARTYPEGQ